MNIVARQKVLDAVQAAERKHPEADILDVAQAVAQVLCIDDVTVLEVMLEEHVQHARALAEVATA